MANGETPRQGQERRTNSEPRVGQAVQPVRRYMPNGQQTPGQPREALSGQLRGDPRLQGQSPHSQERGRPPSEPRIQVGAGVNTRFNVARPPPSVGGQMRPAASQVLSMESPRREPTTASEPSPHKKEGTTTMPSERCPSE